MALFAKKKKQDEAATEEEKEEGKEEEAGKKDKKAAKEEEAAPEGEEGAEGGEGAAAAPKKSKKKIIIIGVLAILLIAGGVGGAYYAGLFGHGSAENGVQLGADGKPIEKPVFYTLPEFLVNLNTGGKQSSFLKATIVLEVPKQLDVPQIEANLPRLLDSFNTYLRELRASDLAGSAGIQRLREELLLRANKSIAPTKINDVLFKEIIIQ